NRAPAQLLVATERMMVAAPSSSATMRVARLVKAGALIRKRASAAVAAMAQLLSSVGRIPMSDRRLSHARAHGNCIPRRLDERVLLGQHDGHRPDAMVGRVHAWWR